MDRALTTLDHFPSLAEIKNICDTFQLERGNAANRKSQIEDMPCDGCSGNGIAKFEDANCSTYFATCSFCNNGALQRKLGRGVVPDDTLEARGLKRK